MKENLMNSVQAQISGNLDCVDAKELGEAVDMIKDLSEEFIIVQLPKLWRKMKKNKK